MASLSLQSLRHRTEVKHTAPLVIGLINNMPDSALRSTERQFRDLLAASAGGRPLRLRVFSLPGVPRCDAGRQYIEAYHEPIAALWRDGCDGLIVTGTEPRAACLEDEPYWPMLTRLIDWAEANTRSTVWSCLAAHGAVRHLDGIARRPLGGKLSGVFDCTAGAGHPLLGLAPSRWRVPHSRQNEVVEADLAACGYRVLSRSREAGVDLFTKQRNSLFVFLQGHPEYDPGALLREYRRDVTRFLAGQRHDYPGLPHGYFREAATIALQRFQAEALRQRKPDRIEAFPMAAAAEGLTGPWRPAAVGLFSNWLGYLAEQRACEAMWPAEPISAEPATVLKESYL